MAELFPLELGRTNDGGVVPERRPVAGESRGLSG
jgi:hypothetical protein